MPQPPNDTSSSRHRELIPLWAIESPWREAYGIQFTLYCLLGIGHDIWFHLTQLTYATTNHLIRAIIADVGPTGFSSAIISLTATDTVRFSMVFAGMLKDSLEKRRQRQIAQARAEAQAEARAEAQAAIAEAEARILNAVAIAEARAEAEANMVKTLNAVTDQARVAVEARAEAAEAEAQAEVEATDEAQARAKAAKAKAEACTRAALAALTQVEARITAWPD